MAFITCGRSVLRVR